MNSTNNTQSSRSSMGSHDRKMRYRALLEDLSTLEDDNANNMELIDKTATAVKEAKSLLAEGGVEERVKHPGEGYLDSRVLRAASDLAVRYSEAVSGNVHTYDKQMLAQHIRENPDFWEFPFPLEVPAVSFLFGTFEAEPREPRARAPRQHVERQQAAALQAPENVDRRKRAKRVTPEQMNALLSKLEAHAYLNRKGMNWSKCEGTWKKIAREMNQLPDGSVKTMKQWITVWRDIKSRTLIKAGKLQKQSFLCEGRPLTDINLTEIDKRILSIIRGKTCDNACTKSKSKVITKEKEAVLIAQVFGLSESKEAESTQKSQITDLNESRNVEEEEDDLRRRLLAVKESELESMKSSLISHLYVTYRKLEERINLIQAKLLKRLEKTEEGSAMVSRVLKFISKWYRQQQKPLSYFHAVLDPTSFSKTVENIYHVSFLVRDGSIAVDLDQVHGLPFITPLSKSQQEARDIADEKQFIVSIDVQRWQDLVKAFSIQRPMMVLRR